MRVVAFRTWCINIFAFNVYCSAIHLDAYYTVTTLKSKQKLRVRMLGPANGVKFHIAVNVLVRHVLTGAMLKMMPLETGPILAFTKQQYVSFYYKNVFSVVWDEMYNNGFISVFNTFWEPVGLLREEF